MANWLSNFVVSLTFLSLLNGLGNVTTFLLYSVLSLAGLFFCFRFVPETKGVPLEIIERNLRAGRPLRDHRKVRKCSTGKRVRVRSAHWCSRYRPLAQRV